MNLFMMNRRSVKCHKDVEKDLTSEKLMDRLSLWRRRFW